MRPPYRLVVCFALIAAVRAAAAHFAELTVAEINALIPPPPAAKSFAEQSELEVVLQLQAARTPAQSERAKAIDSEDVFFFGSEILGAGFTPGNYPETAELFALLREDFLALNRTAKGAFSRKRPPFVDRRVECCLRVTDSGSYPSGHGMQSALWSIVLAELAPALRDRFDARGRESRWSRIVAGAHFPSDVEAGRVIGEAFAKKVLASPAFQDRMRAARTEFAALPAAR
jgi:acid phosphatase (class A)